MLNKKIVLATAAAAMIFTLPTAHAKPRKGGGNGGTAVIGYNVVNGHCDVEFSSTKDLSNIVIEYASGSPIKYDNLSGLGYTVAGSELEHATAVYVKSGNNGKKNRGRGELLGVDFFLAVAECFQPVECPIDTLSFAPRELSPNPYIDMKGYCATGFSAFDPDNEYDFGAGVLVTNEQTALNPYEALNYDRSTPTGFYLDDIGYDCALIAPGLFDRPYPSDCGPSYTPEVYDTYPFSDNMDGTFTAAELEACAIDFGCENYVTGVQGTACPLGSTASEIAESVIANNISNDATVIEGTGVITVYSNSSISYCSTVISADHEPQQLGSISTDLVGILIRGSSGYSETTYNACAAIIGCDPL